MAAASMKHPPLITSGVFQQEMADSFGLDHGLPSLDVRDLAIAPNGAVYAATANGAAVWEKGEWRTLPAFAGRTLTAVSAGPDRGVYFASESGIHEANGDFIAPPPSGWPCVPAGCLLALPRGGVMLASEGIYELRGKEFAPIPFFGEACAADITHGPKGRIILSLDDGFIELDDSRRSTSLFPSDGAQCWKPIGSRAAAYSPSGTLWLACSQGVARRRGDDWTLFPSETLPHSNITCIAAIQDEVVIGTDMGLMHYLDGEWRYRQGKRWLPDDQVRRVVMAADGTIWAATPQGIGRIRRLDMTLVKKARYYEEEIERRHKRTEYGFVAEVHTAKPGDASEWIQHDTDNDGLWTSMYGAAQCFAYAATRSPEARDRAAKVFAALKFLGDVTQGGANPAPAGFIARTVLPASGPNPNKNGYSPEDDKDRQADDRLWKIMDPRWPLSADGKWWWKCDTSSDELDGHFFFYGLYHDLVAETEEERAPIRAHVAAIADHLISHGFCFVDHDGAPTRWGVYSPEKLNGDPEWFMERGLNSLSILSYLLTAHHITGESRFREAYDMLIREHHYAQNVLVPKIQCGAGSGNQSDDEMAFMCFYNLLRYETDPGLRGVYALACQQYWRLEEPEDNPFFNFVFAASCRDAEFNTAFGTIRPGAQSMEWLERAMETLRRLPLDRFDWRHDNTGRGDVHLLPRHACLHGETDHRDRGCRADGHVPPADERHFAFWNHDPWALVTGGDGTRLADGTVFLLPYYMGLWHGFCGEGR